MKKWMKWSLGGLLTIALCLGIAVQGQAYDLNEQFSVGGIMAGAYQYQWVDDDDNKGRGSVIFQPEMSFRPNDNNEFFAKFGFGAGNGLNGVTNFNLAPWAADQEDDYTDINGRNRDYLLTFWYKYTFGFSEDHTLGASGGIIDATDYLDENAYANDEYTQFMNEALVNGPNGFFPSYDIGGAVQWAYGNWSVNGAVMGVGENDEGSSYQFYGGQLAYALESSLGEGNYRVIVTGTSKDFSNENGSSKSLLGAILSFDQELGDIFGAWIRLGWQDDEAIIDYEALYSGGLNITGKWYGREDDNIGIGYAYLKGDDAIDYTQVAEAYWRFALNDYFAATADVQWMKDEYDTDEAEDIDGIIGSIRVTAEF